MAILLHIDTATSTGSVCLSRNGEVLSEKISTEQRDHAAVIAPFIQEILQETGISSSQIDAIAISGGPGSYTGLRVAASTAKGLCYAWDVPLIAISTLKMMANGIRFDYAHLPRFNVRNGMPEDEQTLENGAEPCRTSEDKRRLVSGAEPSRTLEGERSRTLICPMIDARRMEVFTALYDRQLNECVAPQAVILEKNFLSEFKDRKIIIAGTGQPKAEKLLGANKRWIFCPFISRASYLIPLAEAAFEQQQFADTAYFEPFYLKSVYLPGKK